MTVNIKTYHIKVAPYSFITARELVANLAGNYLMIGENYDVTIIT